MGQLVYEETTLEALVKASIWIFIAEFLGEEERFKPFTTDGGMDYLLMKVKVRHSNRRLLPRTRWASVAILSGLNSKPRQKLGSSV
jgi:hypothetical protein